jgi:hypothetical protein
MINRFKQIKSIEDATQNNDKQISQPPTSASQNACRRSNTGTSAPSEILRDNRSIYFFKNFEKVIL